VFSISQNYKLCTSWNGEEVNVFNAALCLQFKYKTGKNVVFYVIGVVLVICVFHTAEGLKQLFLLTRVVIVLDATHLLIGDSLGLLNEDEARLTV